MMIAKTNVMIVMTNAMRCERSGLLSAAMNGCANV